MHHVSLIPCGRLCGPGGEQVSAALMKHFKPDPRDIKKSINSLIEREYLTREADNAAVYVYCA